MTFSELQNEKKGCCYQAKLKFWTSNFIHDEYFLFLSGISLAWPEMLVKDLTQVTRRRTHRAYRVTQLKEQGK